MAEETAAEEVLCITSGQFRTCGIFPNRLTESLERLEDLLEPGGLRFVARRDCEGNPQYKQIIPYTVLTCDTAVFTYARGKTGGEGRLHALRSVGIGGHVNRADMVGADSVFRRLMAAMRREVEEEIVFPTLPVRVTHTGIVYATDSPVSLDHVGIVTELSLDWPDIRANENAIADAEFCEVEKLWEELPRYETWSQIVLRRLLG